MIVANIESKPLKTIIASIREHISKNGVIILSGILVSEMEDFKDFLLKQNLSFVESNIMGDWCSIVCCIPKN